MTIHESKLNPADDSNLSGSERVMHETARHILAGVWFALAATIPVLFLIIILGDNFPTFGFRRRSIVALSILLSGILGLIYGSAILNAEKIKSGLQASLRGLLVGLLSYFSLFIVFATPTAFIYPNVFYGLFLIGIIFGIGFIIAGWLILITGAVAGWFLYLLRETFNEESRSGN